MNKRKLLLLIVMVALLLPYCTGSGGDTPAPEKNIKDKFKKFITLETLEKAGFEHLGGTFKMLMKGNYLFILNSEDLLLAKFSRNNLQRAFKAQKGQAPKEMITPSSFFFYDEQTLAVFDVAKHGALFFDLDLNYLREVRIDVGLRRIARVGNSIAAKLGSRNENAVAILDDDFKIVKTVIKANRKLPFEGFFPPMLNMVFYPGENLLAHSYWCFPYKKCFVNIHDLDGNLIVTLPWEQPFTQNAKTFKKGSRLYSSNFVGKYGSYYLVKCSYSKVLFGTRFHELYIFDGEGGLKYKGDFPYSILEIAGSFDENKIYFKDDDEGISSIEVTDFL